MNIAMISVHACPIAASEGKETGGLNVYVLELSKALSRRGYALDLYTRSQNPLEPTVKQVAPNVRVIHLPAGPEKPYPKHHVTRYIPIFIQHMMQFIKKESLHYDLLHAHYYLSGIAALELKKRQNSPTPIITTFHTLGRMKNLVARSERETETAMRIRDEELLIQKSNHIVATSQTDKEYLVYLYGTPKEKVSIVTPGVDTSLFQLMDKQDAKKIIGATPGHSVILSVGRIESLKGFDVLLYAMKILVERRPDLRGKACVWIVGGDVSQKHTLWSRELQKLETLRQDLNIQTVVKFVGQQPQSALPAYYASADVLVMPSHYESFGMVALEAMACGTPVIASNVSGISRIIGEEFSATITSAHNPLLLAWQIEQMITQPKHTLAFRTKLRQTALPFDWKHIATQTEKLYRRYIDGTGVSENL